MMKRYIYTLFLLSSLLPAAGMTPAADSIPSGFSRPLEWRLGAEVSPAWVVGTNSFVRGENPEGKRVDASLSGTLQADFSFDPSTREGMLYRGLYQGAGVYVKSFFAPSTLGTPVSAFVYQGAPIAHFTERLSLAYEWQFGAAFGWKYFNSQLPENNAAISTPVTAYMAAGVKLHYLLAERWRLSAGLMVNHYSNGNTSWPNGGVNSAGLTVGLSYILNPHSGQAAAPSKELEAEADRPRWYFDLMAYGAWRKRVVEVGGEAQLCPGKFGVAGVQLARMRRLNRWVAVGPSVDLKWDESAGLSPYWVDGSTGEDMKFYRPPFGKQVSAGVSARAELTMPIFAVNGGIGVNALCPKGDKRFYQSLSLRTFVCRNVYLNVGYGLGNFKDPHNLMLGLGVRLGD